MFRFLFPGGEHGSTAVGASLGICVKTGPPHPRTADIFPIPPLHHPSPSHAPPTEIRKGRGFRPKTPTGILYAIKIPPSHTYKKRDHHIFTLQPDPKTIRRRRIQTAHLSEPRPAKRARRVMGASPSGV